VKEDLKMKSRARIKEASVKHGTGMELYRAEWNGMGKRRNDR